MDSSFVLCDNYWGSYLGSGIHTLLATFAPFTKQHLAQNYVKKPSLSRAAWAVTKGDSSLCPSQSGRKCEEILGSEAMP